MRALEGIKVLDMTRLAPGPYCTMILADMGADVLKIQEPGTASSGRRAEQGNKAASEKFGASLQDGMLSPYNPLNRNKRSMGLNLKNEEARSIFLKLVEKSDVLVEEYRPGVAQRLGIGYDTLSKINPRLVYCAITGYGQDGPYSRMPGHDINYISTAGVLGLISEQGGNPVVPLNIVGDLAGGGLQGALGIVLALMARERTGRGQMVDISMTDGSVVLIAQLLSDGFRTGQYPKRGATYASGVEPYYQVYRTKDEKYLSIGCIEPWFFANLCKALGREDLIPLQWLPEKRDELNTIFREIFRSKTRDEWFAILTKSDICVAKVYEPEEIETDPQLLHRQMIVEIDHPTEGKVKQVGISIKLSDTPGEIRTLTPTPGQHTGEELMQLGYSTDRIAALRNSGAVG